MEEEAFRLAVIMNDKLNMQLMMKQLNIKMQNAEEKKGQLSEDFEQSISIRQHLGETGDEPIN